MSTDEEIDPYELIGIKPEATDQEIKTAYRQKSLKVHPDRNPNNPDAGTSSLSIDPTRKFHELNQAYELLLDPLRRLALDAKLRLKLARKERFKAYDSKRKNLVEELEERERAFKKARVEKQQEEIKVWHETEKIKEEGRKMREEREKALRPTPVVASPEPEPESEIPTLGDFDTTVRIKFSIAAHPDLTTPASLVSFLSPFGAVDDSSVVLSIKPPKKAPTKPPKYGTALVPFKRIGDAFAAVCASGKVERGLKGVDIRWVDEKEPPILVWLKKMGKLGAEPASSSGDGVKATLPQHQSKADPSTFASSFPDITPDIAAPKLPSVSGLGYEEMTLMRLRQAERDRLEREIREQEAAD
ncbi:DnaJ-domain-containing protein [Pleurotus eryngii]|uniref:DnaJ-domain-containing protein n=1 Tax=Pleurotus eryngii TaxID=5323 RepID=A0A9P6DJJ9_PLEER|nr:DnaJ-domain-containing protein [Pleurotus eryngii]